MSINQRKDKLRDVHKKEHCWVAKKYSRLWIYATRCMNITDIVNKVTYKSENVQFHLYEIQEQVQLVYVNRKQWKKWLPRAERERSFLHTLRWWKGSLSGLGLQRYTHLSKVIKCNPKINALHRPILKSMHFTIHRFYLNTDHFTLKSATSKNRCSQICELTSIYWVGQKVSSVFDVKIRHIFHFHQELYWTTYSPFRSTTFCHFPGNFKIPSSQNLSFWGKNCSR